MTILIHSSKTMRHTMTPKYQTSSPALLQQAIVLADFLRQRSADDLQAAMKLSGPLAKKVMDICRQWSADPDVQTPAINAFIGDVYSGLRAHEWSETDNSRATERLRVLSGLYGILKPFDGIYPYRLEMGYRLQPEPYASLYEYWGGAIARQLPAQGTIVNLAPVEYAKAVLPHLEATRIITPTFLTIHPQTKLPTFVAVHAKIARGAYARWLIQNNISELENTLSTFNDLGYVFQPTMSSPRAPVYVCEQFGGLGLSVRLS